MAKIQRSRRLFDFGRFRLDVGEQLLLRGDERVKLAPKAFELLVVLLEARGRLLTKDELLSRLWPDSFVEEGNLSYNISLVRKALGGGPGEPRFIETVPKRGYRFVDSHSLPPERAPTRLVVLPFSNEEPELEYLSDGLTETLISHFSCLPDVRVIARTTASSYKGRPLEIRHLVRELNVALVVAGSLRQHNDMLHVHAELVDAASGTQLWGKRYDCPITDIVAVQVEIAETVRARLRPPRGMTATGSSATPRAPRSDVYCSYLKGMHCVRKGTEHSIKRGMEYFAEALAIDPNYALAHVGLAHGYIALSDWYSPAHAAMPQARAAAARALQIDERLAAAHTARAAVAAFYDWDFDRAGIEYRRGVELSPNDAEVHHFHGWYLIAVGQFEGALAEMNTALELDPLNMNIHADVGLPSYFAGDYADAIEQYRTAIDLEPNWFWSRYLLGLAFAQAEDLDQAFLELSHAARLHHSPQVLAALGHVHARAGRTAEARAVISDLTTGAQYVSPYEVATIHAGLGDDESALAWLEKAHEERSALLSSWLSVDPRFDRVRPHPRCQAMLGRLGLDPAGRGRGQRPLESNRAKAPA